VEAAKDCIDVRGRGVVGVWPGYPLAKLFGFL
jgi:hypothetical protein